MELGITSSSFLIGVILIFIVLAAHCYLHIRKHGKEFLFVRTFLLFVGLVGLLLLFAKPHLVKTSALQNIILSTNFPQVPDGLNDLKTATSVHELLNSTQEFDTIMITGNGLSKSDLKLLDSFNINFIPSEKIRGFISIDLPSAKEKEPWLLNGTLNQTQPQKVNLELSDGKILESESDIEGNFSFRITSQSSGHFTYKISAQYIDTTITEDIPIKILPSQKWNLIALSSSPSFELNYLKNYWVKLGNGFSLKQKVSNERYKETFLNNPKIALDKIDSKVLNKFNFILVDTKSWNELKDDAQKFILNYVSAGRIGLLFMGVEQGDVIEKLAYLKVNTDSEVISEETNIKISQSEPPKGFRNIRTNKFTIAGARKYGLGNLGVMTIPETYRFILGDDLTTYQNLWAKIFSELYISPSEDVIFKNAKWNWENEDVQINIYSRTDLEENGYLNSKTEIPITKTKEQIGMYSATTRANAGWNSFSVNANKNTHRFYTHSADSWPAMKQAHLHKINQAAASQTKNIVKKENYKTEELPFYWGLILSLIGLGSLWLHERIYV